MSSDLETLGFKQVKTRLNFDDETGHWHPARGVDHPRIVNKNIYTHALGGTFVSCKDGVRYMNLSETVNLPSQEYEKVPTVS